MPRLRLGALLDGTAWRKLVLVRPRGRAWIAVVAFALIGIVTMQLYLLRLNTSIGHSLQRAAELQRENATLSIDNSEARSGEAVEQKGRAAGMVTVAPGALRFLASGKPGQAQRAAQELRSSTVSSSSAGVAASGSVSGYATNGGGETAVEAPSAESGASAEGQTAAGAEASAGEAGGEEAAGGAQESSAESTGAGGYTEAGGSGGAAESTGAPSSQGSGEAAAATGATSESSGEQTSLGAGGGTQAGAGG